MKYFILLFLVIYIHPVCASSSVPDVNNMIGRCYIRGHLPSCYNLGVYYSRIEKDDSKATYYYTKSCEYSELASCINLYLASYAYKPKESLGKITTFCLQFKNRHPFCRRFLELTAIKGRIDLNSLSKIISEK